jgi:hypothetical protein
MPKFPTLSSLFTPIVLMAILAVSGANAESGSDVLNQRLKASLNTMVKDVHDAETPAAKREVLNRFIARVAHGAAVIGRTPFLSEENHAALNVLKGKFEGYSADLQGEPGQGTSRGGVADGNLDAYASYMQQSLEQADNGIYLSTGAIIIVLLIILILL